MAQRILPSALAAEAILPRAHRCKHGELVLKWLAGVLLGRAAHRSDGAAQKRVVASLKRDRRRQAWRVIRSEEHTSELQSLMRISYAVFCLKKKKSTKNNHNTRVIKNKHLMTQENMADKNVRT